MKYAIKVSNTGHHIVNPLIGLAGRAYDTREEACEAIYDVLESRIEEFGLEGFRPMPVWEDSIDDEENNRLYSEWLSEVHDYIISEGYATEDGVTAYVDIGWSAMIESAIDDLGLVYVSDDFGSEFHCYTAEDFQHFCDGLPADDWMIKNSGIDGDERELTRELGYGRFGSVSGDETKDDYDELRESLQGIIRHNPPPAEHAAAAIRRAIAKLPEVSE